MKNFQNARKSKFLKESGEKIEENVKEEAEKLKAIRRRHTLIGKKNYDDHDLAKIDLNRENLFKNIKK